MRQDSVIFFPKNNVLFVEKCTLMKALRAVPFKGTFHNDLWSFEISNQPSKFRKTSIKYNGE